ncbi:MAG TPA: hypothetical protein VIN37_02900 [Candidatus Limnocylindria bacterium]
MSESTVKVEEGTLVGYRVQGAQRNRDGSELEGPRVFLVFKYPLERVEAHLGTFARLIKRDRVIKFTELRFIEQLEFEALKDPTPADRARLKDPLGTFPAADKNGHDAGKAREVVAGDKQPGPELVTSGGPKKRGKRT